MRLHPRRVLPCPELRLRSLPPLRTGLAVLLLALAGVQPALAQGYEDTPFKPDAAPDAPKSVKPGRAWQEDAVRLPAWPRDGDLVEVKLDGPAQPLKHRIDTKSLTIGRDGVVRYTVVTESPSGTRNVSFEGLRCSPKGRWKTYAFGTGGKFEPTTVADEWREITSDNGDSLHYELWQHYLCVPRTFAARPTSEQVRMLKSGRVPRVENTGFVTD
jgi:hypothetical protein